MTTYTDEVNVYNPEAIASGIADAGETATNYLSTVDQTGLMVHPANDSTTGWKISSAIELLKSGVSYIKLWLEGNPAVAKLRLGLESAQRFLINSDSLQAYDSNNSKYFEVSSSGLTFGSNTAATTSALNTEIDQRKATYGTCSTAASTQTKAVTCANFELVAGNELTVKFTTANTYVSGAVKLNVNSKGAVNVWAANATTSATNKLLWAANAYITFRYDGTQFIVIGEPRTWYGACSTAASTAAKTDTTAVTGCVICKGTKVSLAMSNENTASAPTLNIGSTGALAIYAGNSTTRPTASNGLSWSTGYTQEFIFDGTQWRTGDSGSSARAKAQSDAANSRTQLVYYRTSSEDNAPQLGPTTWVTSDANAYNTWTTKVPPMAASTDDDADQYPFLYVAIQYQTMAQQAAGSTCTCSPPLLDESIAVINGSMLVKGSVTAEEINVGSVQSQVVQTTDLSANQLTSGTINAERIGIGTISTASFDSETQDRLDGFGDSIGTLQTAIRIENVGGVPSMIFDPSGTNSGITSELTNSAMSFKDDGMVVAQISNQQLLIEDARVNGNLFFGGFAFIPRYNGNLSLKWVGGTSHMNLLKKTGNIETADCFLSRSTVSGGIITLTPTTSSAYAKLKVNYLDYADFAGSTLTFSFDARVSSASTSYTTVKVLGYVGVNDSTRLDYNFSTSYDKYASETFTDITTEWKRFVITKTIPDDLTSGVDTVLGQGNYVTVQLGVSGSCKPIDVRNIKLENEKDASPWSKNPND